MLDAEAPVVCAAERRRIRVQYRAIRPVADGVRVHLKPMRDRIPSHTLDVFFPQDQQTRVARIIGVWLLQRCAARAQRTIRHQLDAPNGQPVAEFRPALQKLAP